MADRQRRSCKPVLHLPAALCSPGVFGAYLLAIYDPESEAFQTISKLGTGFSEEQLTVSEWLQALQQYTVHSSGFLAQVEPMGSQCMQAM